jgi:SPP1 family predicted phage head-tail adaptor
MNINGVPTNPGELRNPILLQQRVVVTQPGGFEQVGYQDVATVYAKWQNIHGQEVWAVDSPQEKQPATVTLRYRSDIDTTWAVVNGGKRYEIVSLDDIQNRHEYIELKVQIMRAR